MGRGYNQFLEEHWGWMTGESPASTKLTPFFTVQRDDEEAVLGWCDDTMEALSDYSLLRGANMVNNIRFYNAIQSATQRAHGDCRIVTGKRSELS